MKTQPLTKSMVQSLQHMAGMGAMIMNWDVDYEVGQGILEGLDRCLWTKKGLRTTCAVASDGGFIISQSKEPDPEYFELKKEVAKK